MVLVLLTVLAVVVGVSSLQTKIYEGTARLLIKTQGSGSVFDPTTGVVINPDRTVETEIEVLKSQPVQAAVKRMVGAAPGVSAAAVNQTDVIKVRAQDPNPSRAATVTNAYAKAYIDYKRTQAVGNLLAAVRQIQSQITELQPQIDASSGLQKTTLIDQQGAFKQKLDQLQVDAALNTGGAQLVGPATVPTSPVKPRLARSAALGLALGLALGIGLAFVLDYLDDSVKTKEDLEQAAPGLVVVGMIPKVADWKLTEDTRLVSLSEPTDPASEAYRTLRTSIQFMGLDKPVGTLQVTSANAEEGKTATLANLGVALARAGRPVVLVCCDLRRPRIHEFFDLPNAVGLTSVLLGDVALSEAMQDVEGVERLRVLASGPLPPDPSELLSSRRTLEVLSALQATGNMVLIDCPPVLPVTDALVLSSVVDATLLICRAEQTRRKDVARARELLEQVGAPLVGTVLNAVTPTASYGYSYKYRQGEDPRPRPQRPMSGGPRAKPTQRRLVSMPSGLHRSRSA